MSAGGRRSREDNMEESPSSRGSPFGDCINWRERCLHLEDSLNRFRQQAGKIRSALGQKVVKTVCHVVCRRHYRHRIIIISFSLSYTHHKISDSPSVSLFAPWEFPPLYNYDHGGTQSVESGRPIYKYVNITDNKFFFCFFLHFC